MATHGISTEYMFCDNRPFNAPHLGSNQSQQSHQQQHTLAFQTIHRGNAPINPAALKLNLESDPLPECFNSLLENNGHSPMLGSPDLNLLKLGSPELEKLIMSEQNQIVNGASMYANGGGQNGGHELARRHHRYPTAQNVNRNHTTSNSHHHPNASNLFANELQFITETNQALESLLAGQGRHHGDEGDSNMGRSSCSLESMRPRSVPGDEFHQDNEGLQQVPESSDNDHMLTSIMTSNGMFDDLHGYSSMQQQQHLDHDDHQLSFSHSNLFDDCQNDNLSQSKNSRSVDSFKPTMVPMSENQSSLLLKQRQLANGKFDAASDVIDTMSSKGSYPVLPLPPIDLEVQEIVKRERKKLKNRVAASKCRKKKLEREAQLEVRVQQLKDKNIELNAVASALRMQVNEMKRKVLEHINTGCRLCVNHASY